MDGHTPDALVLGPELAAVASSMAAELGRPEGWVIEQAVREFAAQQAWQLEAIDAGIAGADAGRTVSHEAVVAWAASWGTENELPIPECG